MEVDNVKAQTNNSTESYHSQIMKQEALGRHLLVEYYECDSDKLLDGGFIEETMLEAAKRAGATIVNCNSHSVYPFGCTTVVVIQESHLAIHTWPCYRFAAVDLYTCGNSVNPWNAFEFISKQILCARYSAVEFKRGMPSLLPTPDYSNLGTPIQEEALKQEIVPKPKYTRHSWLTDISSLVGVSVRITGDVLYRKQSAFQRVEVFESKQFGKMLVNDGIIMCTEETEHSYHEMIAHIPLLTHPNPKRVLIIGGGDGGTAREVLRHEQLEKVVEVEIDDAVVEACKLHLPSMACSYDNPKLELLIDDGIKYVQNSPDNSFDIILVDSTDPIGPGAVLFTDEFFKHCYRVLTKDGIMVTQGESPTSTNDKFVEIYGRYFKAFGRDKVFCTKYHTPTYPGDYWTFSYCSKGDSHPLKCLDKEKSDAFSAKHRLRYYDAATHEAALVHPRYVKKMMKEARAQALD
eukprot:CAMPEP_0176474706 /NCGR_PEP_ID=MMETSP0127-20121128/43182_1 /TAXON_ID=938130 /ORGANISM="Platyophrya macrostoma, Strain WH" /LENGTH=461 /DNA_ID=CAMNT_0017870185 /DNA_START=47 /DNA_END=1432 /DNA_ORIENTATION=+